MTFFGKLFNFLKSIAALISLLLIFLVVVITYSSIFILVPIHDVGKTIVALVICILIGHFTFLLWQKIFAWNKVSKNIARAVVLLTALVLPSGIFAFPIHIPGKLEQRPAHVLIDVDKDQNQVAFFEMKAKEPKTTTPILYIVGGPGGAVSNSTFDFLKKYTDLGIDVYTYDPLGNADSPRAKNPETDYTIAKEVERMHAVVEKIGAEKVVLMGNSFGGNLIARYIDKYPESVAKYISIDTAPIYSMSGNTQKESEINESQQLQNGDSSAFLSVDMNLREKTRMILGFVTANVLHRIPYGNNQEYSYFMTKTIDQTNQDLQSNQPLACKNAPKVPNTHQESVYLSFESSMALNADLMKTPDFTPELKEKSRGIPVLLFHPECGVVPWETHVAYKDFFSDVKIIAVPGAQHHIWETVSGEKMLLEDGASFIFNEDISSREWTDKSNPF